MQTGSLHELPPARLALLLNPRHPCISNHKLRAAGEGRLWEPHCGKRVVDEVAQVVNDEPVCAWPRCLFDGRYGAHPAVVGAELAFSCPEHPGELPDLPADRPRLPGLAAIP